MLETFRPNSGKWVACCFYSLVLEEDANFKRISFWCRWGVSGNCQHQFLMDHAWDWVIEATHWSFNLNLTCQICWYRTNFGSLLLHLFASIIKAKVRRSPSRFSSPTFSTDHRMVLVLFHQVFAESSDASYFLIIDCLS